MLFLKKKNVTKKSLVEKENEIKEYNSGLSNACKEKPEDSYRWDETVHKYENTDTYMND